MIKCTHCGSNKGAFTVIEGIQYYSWEGEPQGYLAENESIYAKCVKCGRRVSMNRILKESERLP